MCRSAWSPIFIIMWLYISSTDSINGRFMATLFGYPSTCAYKNHLHRCTFTFTCWLVGGTLQSGCGEEYDWLFTCCVPSSLPITNGNGEEKQEESSDALKTHHGGWKHYSLQTGTDLPLAMTLVDHPNQVIARTPIKRQDNSMHLSDNSQCGVPAIQLQKRIIGGNEAYFGEFPWQAHIRIAGYQCGGVLVSPWFVVTAAHCIHRARLRDIKVFLGEYDTQNTGNYIELLPEEIHKVSKKILHPFFQFRITQPDRFDIALLKLSRKVQYKENILPICLPTQSDSFEGYTGVVAGWGKTDTTYGKTGTNVLQKAGVPILSDEECLLWHKHKNIHVELHQEMFCAGHSDGHTDACLGDSGGPLIVFHNGKWTLAGITSAGFGCAVDHQPGIYHKVALTSKWITGIINKT